MVIYGQLIVEIKVSRVEILRLLKKIYFDKVLSKEQMNALYKLLSGKEAGELISEDGEYKLVVTRDKRLKISLHNQFDVVKYTYTVGIGFLWRRGLQDAMCEAVLDICCSAQVMNGWNPKS
ncbi:MAG: hypothetical protein E7261_11250 [Lachnospiraceae bacterium]|nr:hypothetical protein [Lachnospiraceae bacterium]